MESPRLSQDELALQRRLQDWCELNSEGFVQLLSEWISYPSVGDMHKAAPGSPFGPEVRKMFDRVIADSRALGFTVVDQDGYALTIADASVRSPHQASIPAAEAQRGSRPTLALVSHIDVVPPGEGWTHPPFIATRQGHFVIGRGAHDDKGPALLDLFVLKALRDLEISSGLDVVVVLGGDEETDMNDMRHYAQTAKVPDYSFVTDGPFPVNYGQKGLLTIELRLPTGPVLATLRGGSAPNAVPDTARALLQSSLLSPLREHIRAGDVPDADRVVIHERETGVEVEFRGISGHAAFPEGSLNAIVGLARVLQCLTELDDADRHAAETIVRLWGDPNPTSTGTVCRDDSGPLTLNLGLARPEANATSLTFDMRYPMTADGMTVISKFSAAAVSAGARDLSVVDSPAYYISPENPIVRLLGESFNDLFDLNAKPIATGGGTHSRVLPNAITFGPDFWHLPEAAARVPQSIRPDGISPSGGDPHSHDEYVSVPHLMASLQLYVLAITRLGRYLSTSAGGIDDSDNGDAEASQ